MKQQHHHNVSIDILQPICETLYGLLVHLFWKKRDNENQSLYENAYFCNYNWLISLLYL